MSGQEEFLASHGIYDIIRTNLIFCGSEAKNLIGWCMSQNAPVHFPNSNVLHTFSVFL